MKGFTWNIEHEKDVIEAPAPLLVTWRMVRDALRRTWKVWVGAGLVGAILGIAAFLLMTAGSTATTTLLLVQPAGSATSSSGSLTTDVSFLTSRSVAASVIADEGLTVTPDQLLSRMTVEPVTDQILRLTVSAEDSASAVALTNAVVKHFFEFRNEQLRTVSSSLIDGYQAQVDALKKQVAELTTQYIELRGSDSAIQERSADILAQRAQISGQISTLQQSIEGTTVQTEAAIGATHVLDQPAADQAPSRRKAVLNMASGLILGGAGAISVIVFRALTSDRVRRRRDVSSALGVPVRVSVPSTGPRGEKPQVGRHKTRTLRSMLRVPLRRPPATDAALRDQDLLVDALLSALPSFREPPIAAFPSGREGQGPGNRHGPDKQTATLGLAGISDTAAAALLLLDAADRLAVRGLRVVVVDLTSEGALVEASTAAGAAPSPVLSDHSVTQVVRPSGRVESTPGPLKVAGRRSAEPSELGPIENAWNAADVALALVELRPAADVGNLRTWTRRVVPLVRAGRTNRERLETIGGLVRATDLDMPFALVEGADRWDESMGLPVEDATEADPLYATGR